MADHLGRALDLGRPRAPASLANRGGHRKDTRIATRYHRDVCACGRFRQRARRTIDFLPVIGGLAALTCSSGNPIQIRAISVHHVGGLQRICRFGRELTDASGTQPDHRNFTAHEFHARPVTNTIAK